MPRSTVDFGIDLGTTNSAVAMLKGTAVEVFRNPEGDEYTPSVVWIDRNERLYVGRRARERLLSDHDNAAAEFKLQMGRDFQRTFARSGRTMRPEELSAEVLKSLKADVGHRLQEEIQAAVITVPASFELPQCEATRQAAELAGLTFSPLLLEPVAAGLAYGFESEDDKVFWFVYDLGGGTFDAAVLQFREGVINVVNHGGDPSLGGKLIDWEIVEQLFIPALTRDHPLTDFGRGNPRWQAAVAKLKLEAEESKIRLSRDESVEVLVETLCEDDRGESVDFEYELRRRDLERLAEPYIVQTVNICKRVLTERRLGTSDIEKVILVGGPTLMPYLRERLADPHEGLGISLDTSFDPLTVVARGAAIFAGTQRVEGLPPPTVEAGQYGLELEYRPVGADPEPLVGGRVLAEGEDLSGFTIEFVDPDARPAWRSGAVALGADGTFVTNLWAEKGREHTFLIELRDAGGRQHETVPDRLTYVFRIEAGGIPLIHSVGVALANSEMLWFIERGTPLPAKKRHLLETATEVRKGQSGDVIRIPVAEGESKRAGRNRRIGVLEVQADQVRRDVPAGSEVEVTIEIDESRQVRAKAFVFVLDEEFEDVLTLSLGEAPEHDQLAAEAERETKRLEELRGKVAETGDARAQDIVRERIDRERMEHEIEASVAASRTDPDAAAKAERRLLDLTIALDEVEDTLEWPALVQDAESIIESVRDVVAEHGDSDDRRDFERREAEVRSAIETEDVYLLGRRVDALRGLAVVILDRKGIMQAVWFQDLSEHVAEMRDPAEGEDLVAQGNRAILEDDIDTLRAVNRKLVALLPSPPPPPGIDGTLRKTVV